MIKFYLYKHGGYLLVCLFILLFSACDKKAVVPDLEEFTRADREKLGDFIEWEMTNDGIYDILPQAAPYDTLYWYTQKLYNQAISVLQRDQQSPANNRWANGRSWDVLIFEGAEKSAFVLPGGNLYLSTGLLKSLEKEYELYYFLAFEANIMHEDFLLKQLVREYNAITLRNVISGSAPANSTTLDIIARELPALVFETETVESIDGATLETICQTSVYDRVGIAPFILNSSNDEAAWLASRKSYNGRPEHLEAIEIEGDFDCGSFKGNGFYSKYVLDVLAN
ncbi:MAG: hypothetical protein ACI9XO_003862 [Paraglaciecola sp.]|jgi:hypothetical protein